MPPTGRPVTDDWRRGEGGQLAGALLLDAGPWFLIIFAVAVRAPRWVVLLAGALVVFACVSLAVGAITKRSLAMRFVGWPRAAAVPRTEAGAAWIELLVLFIILLFRWVFEYWGGDRTPQIAALTAAVAGCSAIAMVTTGKSLGRRLLRVLEEL